MEDTDSSSHQHEVEAIDDDNIDDDRLLQRTVSGSLRHAWIEPQMHSRRVRISYILLTQCWIVNAAREMRFKRHPDKLKKLGMTEGESQEFNAEEAILAEQLMCCLNSNKYFSFPSYKPGSASPSVKMTFRWTVYCSDLREKVFVKYSLEFNFKYLIIIE